MVDSGWYHSKNILVGVDPDTYSTLNTALDNACANVRFGPPMQGGKVMSSRRMVGLYMHAEDCRTLGAGPYATFDEAVGRMDELRKEWARQETPSR